MFIVSEWVVAEAIDDTTKMLVEISVRADCCGSGWWCDRDAGEDQYEDIKSDRDCWWKGFGVDGVEQQGQGDDLKGWGVDEGAKVLQR